MICSARTKSGARCKAHAAGKGRLCAFHRGSAQPPAPSPQRAASPRRRKATIDLVGARARGDRVESVRLRSIDEVLQQCERVVGELIGRRRLHGQLGYQVAAILKVAVLCLELADRQQRRGQRQPTDSRGRRGVTPEADSSPSFSGFPRLAELAPAVQQAAVTEGA